MSFTFGDKQIPWGGLYDEFDPRDSVPGTFKELTNVVVGRKFSTIENRGGFVKWKDLPTEGNGLKTGLTIVKVLHGAQFKVTKPTEQLITVLICLCSYQPTGGGGLQYTWRIFQNPSYSAPNFGASTTWQEKEIFYIDIVETNKTLSVLPPSVYSFTITAPTNGAYFDGDFEGGYIFLEGGFDTGLNFHYHEGDLVIGSAFNDFDTSTNTISLTAESYHSLWTASNDFARFHKNLENGFVPYQEIVSGSSSFFDQYTFSHHIENETLVIAVNAGKSGRASFSIRFNYLKQTFFSTGNIKGTLTSMQDQGGGVQDVYEARFIYGFPGYSNIVKSGANSFNGKTCVIDSYTGTVQNGSYNKHSGKLRLTITGVIGINSAMTLQSCDISKSMDDFFLSEADVHGRWGAFKRFNGHVAKQAGIITSNTQGYVNPDLPSGSADGVAGVAPEQAFTNNTFLHVHTIAILNGFRYGLHSESTHQLNNASYLTAIVYTKIPANFNKNINAVAIVMAAEFAAIKDITAQAIQSTSRLVKTEKLDGAAGWDFYLQTNGGDGHLYVKSSRIDKTAYTNGAFVGGNHIALTGNPTYARKIITSQLKSDISLSADCPVDGGGREVDKVASSIMVQDYSFAPKSAIVIKGRTHAVDVRFQEYQMGVIQGEIYEDRSNGFYTPIAQFGPTHHLFDHTTLKIACSDIAPLVAVSYINFPQGLDQLITHDRDVLVYLGENGVKFVDLSNNLLSSPVVSSSPGDTCIARLSVVNEGGILFCAGETGVYMFRGYEKIDISLNLHPKARIKKTWRELSRSKKQKAIGAFHRGRGYYVLCIPDDNTFYVFDIQGAQTQ